MNLILRSINIIIKQTVNEDVLFNELGHLERVKLVTNV